MPLSFQALMSVGNGFFMDYISVMALCLDSAFGMVVFRTAFPVHPVMDEIGRHACNDGNDEKYDEENEGLIRDYCQHHEGLVA